jgi:hypothetical protein
MSKQTRYTTQARNRETARRVFLRDSEPLRHDPQALAPHVGKKQARKAVLVEVAS